MTFFLDGGYLTVTGEILGKTIRLLFCLEAVQSDHFRWQESKMSDSGEGAVIYFLTSIPQCHLAVFCG